MQGEHAAAVREGEKLEAKANDNIANLNSQLDHARSEYSAESEAAEDLKSTIRKLQDAVAAETSARKGLEKDADVQTLELTQQVSNWCFGCIHASFFLDTSAPNPRKQHMSI